MSQSNFTDSEWETCIKVLTALKDDPMQNPDNQTFKTLIKKIYKKARKTEHQQKKNLQEKEVKGTLLPKSLATPTPIASFVDELEKKEQKGTIRQIRNYFGF